jgi:hypothetical protein
MKQRHGWLIALAIVILLVAACGPQPATPTPKAAAGTTPTAKASVTGAVATAGPTVAPTATVVPLDLSKLPIDANDWHALGPADAKVTIVEYSEFM